MAYDRAIALYAGMQKGDRVRIKEGYSGAGESLLYIAKSEREVGQALVRQFGNCNPACEILTEAIEPYPYTREERIERAIDDFDCSFDIEYNNVTEVRAALYAILDAGV